MSADPWDRGPSDPRRIFAAMERHGVDYVAIGGIAVMAHGHPRNTRDVDLVAATAPENLSRLAAALVELDAQLWGVDAHLLGIDVRDPRTLANDASFTMVTAAGGLDLFNEVPGGAPYEQLRARSLVARVGGVAVRYAGLDDLIRMKRAGRPRDLRDIAALAEPGAR